MEIARLGSGAHVGDGEILGAEKMPVSMIATTDVVVMEVSRADLLQTLRSQLRVRLKSSSQGMTPNSNSSTSDQSEQVQVAARIHHFGVLSTWEEFRTEVLEDEIEKVKLLRSRKREILDGPFATKF